MITYSKWFISMFFTMTLTACAYNTSQSHTPSHASHTSKLETTDVNLNFISKDKVSINYQSLDVTELNLKVLFENAEMEKKVLLDKKIFESQVVEIDLDSNLKEGLVVAVLSGETQGGQKISKVSTYDVKNQEKIDQIRSRRRLKN